MGHLVIFGHRGQGPTSRRFENQILPNDVLPENSISAFEKALQDGADGIELDVFITKDGKIVVCHDNELDRNVNGHFNHWNSNDELEIGKIADKTLAEVKEYDIGNGEHMPELQEVLHLVDQYNKKTGKNITINIEIKGKGPIVDKVYETMNDAVQSETTSFDWSSFMVNSFDRDALAKMHSLNPDNKLRLSFGIYTWSVFGARDSTGPKWLPVQRKPAEDGNGEILTNDQGTVLLKKEIDVASFEEIVKKAKNAGCNAVDVVSSDLTESMFEICNRHNMHITATTNMIRARAQKDIEFPGHNLSDEQIEEEEIYKMYNFSKKYPNVAIYYKADTPKHAVVCRQELEAAANLTKSSIFAQSPSSLQQDQPKVDNENKVTHK